MVYAAGETDHHLAERNHTHRSGAEHRRGRMSRVWRAAAVVGPRGHRHHRSDRLLHPLHQRLAGHALRLADGRRVAGLRPARLRTLGRGAAHPRCAPAGTFVIGKTPITGDPVILAPGREERPNVYDGAPCPFCPGAEDQTPPEIVRDGDPWRIRVFPNRYPPTENAEVVVESANHDDVFDALSPDHAQRVIEITFDRYHAMTSDAAYVCIFKNHGRLAGASIPHLHSQLVGTPVV